MHLLRLLLAVTIPYFIGFPLYFFINCKNPDLHTKQECFIIPYSLGLGLLPLFLFYISFFGIPLCNRNIALLIILFVILTISLKIRSSFFRSKEDITDNCNMSFVSSIGKAKNSFAILLIIIILATIIFSTFFSLSKPIDTWDALFHWTYKAKILYYERTIYSPSFTDLTEEITRIHKVPNHPLLLPMLEFYISVVIKKYDERLIKIWLPIFFIVLILFFLEKIRLLFSINYALFCTLFLVTIPFFYYQRIIDPLVPGSRNLIFGGNADLPLAFFYFAHSIYIFQWLKKKNLSDIIMAALYAVFAVYTKNEGLAIFTISSFTLALLLFIDLKNNWKKDAIAWFILILMIIILIVPRLEYGSSIPSVGQKRLEKTTSKISIPLKILSNTFKNYRRIPFIIYKLGKNLLNIQLWGMLWPLFLTSLIISRKTKLGKAIKYLLLLQFFQLVMIVSIYTSMPQEELNFILPMVTLSRLLFHIVPLTVFFSFYQLAFLKKKNH